MKVRWSPARGGCWRQALVPGARAPRATTVLLLARADADVTRRRRVACIRPDCPRRTGSFQLAGVHPRRRLRVRGRPRVSRSTRSAPATRAAAAAAHGAAILTISTDYVFDGTAQHAVSRVRRAAAPRVGVRRVEAGGRAGGARSDATPSHRAARRGSTAAADQLRRHDPAEGARRAIDLQRRRRPARLADVDARISRRRWCALARPTRYGTLPRARTERHCTWHDLAAFALAGGRDPRLVVDRTSTGARSRARRARPAYSVLSEPILFEQVTGARLPHWQDACRSRVSRVEADAGRQRASRKPRATRPVKRCASP